KVSPSPPGVHAGGEFCVPDPVTDMTDASTAHVGSAAGGGGDVCATRISGVLKRRSLSPHLRAPAVGTRRACSRRFSAPRSRRRHQVAQAATPAFGAVVEAEGLVGQGRAPGPAGSPVTPTFGGYPKCAILPPRGDADEAGLFLDRPPDPVTHPGRRGSGEAT